MCARTSNFLFFIKQMPFAKVNTSDPYLSPLVNFSDEAYSIDNKLLDSSSQNPGPMIHTIPYDMLEHRRFSTNY